MNRRFPLSAGLSCALALATAGCGGSFAVTNGDYPMTGAPKPGSGFAQTAANSYVATLPDVAYSTGYVSPPGTPGRTRGATVTDIFGHRVPAPGMDTSQGGSTTQSLGVSPPGATNTGGE
jgi:hypothetical protein